jgi:hypothetical protein
MERAAAALEGDVGVDFGLSLLRRGERDGEWATGVAQWATPLFS